MNLLAIREVAMLSRSDVVNHFLEEFGLSSYLEIGVEAGVTFNQVLSKDKIAVDPDFKVAQSSLQGRSYRMTSDAYFDDNLDKKFDLVFIDGLHTFEQSLRDLTRSLAKLSDKGILVLDDCFPSDYLASIRDRALCARAKQLENRPDRNWTGDVYKTVLFIHEFFDSLDYSFIKDTMGVVAVWRAPRKIKFLFGGTAVTEIANVEYAHFKFNIAPKLPQKTLAEICAEVRSSRG